MFGSKIHWQYLQLKAVCLSALIVAIASTISSPVSATVLNFDDLPDRYNLTTHGYSGLNWEVGNPGTEGILGNWATASDHPFSFPRNVVNAAGASLMGVGFPSLVDMGGAYFAVQGSPNSVWATAIRVHGYLLGQPTVTTAWLTPLTTTPQWLDMTSLSNVDRIVVEADHNASISDIGAFGMDNLTFTSVPEPGALSGGGACLATILARRRPKVSKALRDRHAYIPRIN